MLLAISSLIYSMPSFESSEPVVYVFTFKDQLRIEFETSQNLESPPILNLRIGFLSLPVEFLKGEKNTWVYSAKIPQNFKDLESYPYMNLRTIFWNENGDLETKNFKVQSPFYRDLKIEFEADTFFDINGPFLKIYVKKPIYFEIQKLSLINSSTLELEFENTGKEIVASIPKNLEEETYILRLELKDSNNVGNTIRLEKRMFYYAGVLIPLDDTAPKIIDRIILTEYTVNKGDTISYIAQKYGVSPVSIMVINNINDPRKLLAGQTIKIGNIIFEPSKIKIVVDLFHSKMYVYYKNHLLKKLPVAVGRADATPPGKYVVMEKRKDPALYWNGEIIPPGSLVNGLGTRWIGLSDPQYGIHGTTKPWEIGRRISHGCIRLKNEDVEKLFEFVPMGTEVLVVESIDSVPEFFPNINMMAKGEWRNE